MSEQEKPKTMEEEYNPEGVKKRKWVAFVEGEAAAFFADNQLEKMTLEDGNGNKAKLSRTKDDSIKVESSSISIL